MKKFFGKYCQTFCAPAVTFSESSLCHVRPESLAWSWAGVGGGLPSQSTLGSVGGGTDPLYASVSMVTSACWELPRAVKGALWMHATRQGSELVSG